MDNEGVLQEIFQNTSNGSTSTGSSDYKFNPYNAGESGQILQKGDNGYSWQDAPRETAIEADSSDGVTFSRGSTTDLTISASSSNDNVYLTFNDGNHSFNVLIPSLRMNGRDLQYSTPTAGTWVTAATVSDLQIKDVTTSTLYNYLTSDRGYSESSGTYTHDGQTPGDPDYALGDLLLASDGNSGYNLYVCSLSEEAPSSVQDMSDYSLQFINVGSIDTVSLVADHVSLASSKLEATNVKGGLEELSDRIENVQATVWSGYVGVTTNSIDDIDNVPLNSFKTYTNASGLIDVEINSYSYIWFVIDNEIVVSCNNIEVPTEYVGEKNGKNYYKTKERIASSIKVELISTTNTQGEEGGGGGGVTPSVEQPQIVSQSSSPANAYDDGDTIDAIEVVVRNPTDGGTLSFQWYQGGSLWGGSGTISSVTEGTKSSLVPESNKPATYYCIITNTLNGYTSTRRTDDIRIKFNSSSASDLSDFTEGKYINSSGNEVDNENYYLSDWFDTGESSNTKVYILNGIVNGNNNTPPPVIAQTRIGDEGTPSNVKKSHGGITLTCGSNVQFRCVIPKSEMDYCFIYIGDTLKYKGSKVTENLLLNMMGSFSDYYNKCFQNNGSNNVSIINDQTTGSTDNVQFGTWITKPIELISGTTYYINVGWTNSNSSYPPKWVVTTELLTSSGGTYVECKTTSANPTQVPATNTVTGSVTNKYLYCSCALKELKNCYVYYVDANKNRVYILKGGNI